MVDQFQLEVPSAARIDGIIVEIRRSGDEFVADDSVRIVKEGHIGAAERASTAVWTQGFSWASYGGPEDLWGEDWTPDDLNADDFGVALSVLYANTVGNTRAYVDQVRLSVHYTLQCE